MVNTMMKGMNVLNIIGEYGCHDCHASDVRNCTCQTSCDFCERNFEPKTLVDDGAGNMICQSCLAELEDQI